MSTVSELMHGAIDMHLHHGPDCGRERSVDALQAALQAEAAGMRAIVLKSHIYPTAPLASIVGQSVRNLSVLGSICLDYEIGGLNPSALDVSAKLGARVVWMPTSSSAHDHKRLGLAGGIRIQDDGDKILPVVEDILDIVKAYDMVLATGHVSQKESFALVDEARRRGLKRIVITHPLEVAFGAPLNVDEQRQMAEKGAFIEHCVLSMMPMTSHRSDPKEVVKAIRTVGAEHCILTTDLGQMCNPTPAEGMRATIATFLMCELSAREIEFMVKTNPAKLLGLS